MKYFRLYCTTIAALLALLLVGACTISAGARSNSGKQQQNPPPPKKTSSSSSSKSKTPPKPKNTTPPKGNVQNSGNSSNKGGSKTSGNNSTGNNPNGGNTKGGPATPGNKTTGTGSTNGSRSNGGRNTGNNSTNAGNRGNTGSSTKGGPAHQYTASNGAVVTTRAGGGVARIESHGTVITHGINGERQIVTPIAGGGRIVTTGRSGFVEHNVVYGGHTFVSRTYVVGGRSFVRVYAPFSYRGVTYYGFVPGFYFRPAFYAWGFAPWGVGISFGWGWGGAAWFGFYAGFFQPYPLYAGPTFWLTDYLIAQNLQLAYENQQLAAANAGQYGPPPEDPNAEQNPTPLSPEVKQAIADEVQRQLALQEQQAAQPASAIPPAGGNYVPPALDPQMSTFIVSSNLEVNYNGQSCELTPGDVIVRIDDNPGPDNAVETKVTNSKKGDCRAGDRPRILVSDLQEMQNQFTARIDAGMQQLAANQGKNGIPAAPAGSTTTTTGPVPMQPDPNAAQLLQNQQATANATEAAIKPSGSGNQ